MKIRKYEKNVHVLPTIEKINFKIFRQKISFRFFNVQTERTISLFLDPPSPFFLHIGCNVTHAHNGRFNNLICTECSVCSELAYLHVACGNTEKFHGRNAYEFQVKRREKGQGHARRGIWKENFPTKRNRRVHVWTGLREIRDTKVHVF